MEFASMRYGVFPATGLLFLTLLLSQISALAFQSGGSYSANQRCYCFGELSASLGKRVVPTPVGGKSVKQVCDRVGPGPALILRDGAYNYPVYKDAQCGHGPFEDSASLATTDCPGTLDGTSASCQPVGPAWDLQAAFGNAIVVAQTEAQPLGPAAAKPVNPHPEAASGSSIADFKGKVVTIEGQRYLQAKQGVDAAGGDPGSRIILDGNVYLRDDTSLDPDDLYQPSAAGASAKARKTETASPKVAPRVSASQPLSREQQLKDSAPIENSASLLSQTLSRERSRRELTGGKGINARPELPIDEISRMLLRVERNRHWVKQSAQTADKSPEPEAPAAALPSDPLPDEFLLRNTVGQARGFSYVEAVPVSFDFGGGGVLLEGTAPKQSPFQLFGQLAMAETYTSAMVGGAYYHAPNRGKRATFMLLAGLEYGEFELNDDVRAPGETFSTSDSGIHVSAGMRFAITPRLFFSSGIGYSTYFEGDARILGGSYYSVTSRLDILSRFRIGDNDLLGIGLRYNY